MTNPASWINLRPILEYAAFFDIPVTFSPIKSPDQKITIRINNITESEFSTLLKSSESNFGIAKKLIGKEVQAVMRYKGRALRFSTQNLNKSDNKTLPGEFILRFGMPIGYELSEKRKSCRTELHLPQLDLIAQIKISKHGDESIYETNEVHYISTDALSLFLPTQDDNAPVSIGDEVLSIKLFNNKKLIMDSHGSIVRIDLYRDIGKTRYLYVIDLSKISEYSISTDKSSLNERRLSDRRLQINNHGTAFVEFSHPIFNQAKMYGEINDISTSGISFFLKKSKLPVVPGMFIQDFQIQFPKSVRHALKIKVVTSQSEIQETQSIVRVGGELTEVSVEFLKDVSTKMIKNSVPFLMDATLEDYDDLWEFFFETGFLYRSKQIQMKKNARRIFDTSVRLLSSNNPLAKTVLYKEEGEIKGHISTIRYFDSSWLIQHLCAKPTRESIIAGHAMIDSMSAFFRNAKANDFVKTRYIVFYFRPDNSYPAAVFNGVKKIINDISICDSNDLRFCLPRNNDLVRESDAKRDEILVREATEGDLYYLQSILQNQEKRHLIESEDLKIGRFTNLEISNEFERLNLYRFRKVLVAENPVTGTRIFAICNYASPGINLSELSNSFRIFSLTENTDDYMLVLNMLSHFVKITYKNTEVDSPVLLLENNQCMPSNYIEEKIYTHWRLDVHHVDKFIQATDMVFANIKKYLKTRKTNSKVALSACDHLIATERSSV